VLISYIRQAAKSAIDSLEPAEVSWRTEIIPAVRVIGEQQISEIMILADKTTQRARRLAVSLFPIAALSLILLLLFVL
jgi:predicted neutral ceramidase superfamily lipid hydrolase